MKKIVLLALSVVASAAMAAGPAGVQTTINGTSTQTASLTNTGVSNTAFGVNANAQQNLASNAGDVEIAGGGVMVITADPEFPVPTQPLAPVTDTMV